ncbi:MAG: hypothetical protein GY793_01355 [Proteobacteria bacterium]|nr:hypothetical protein [Pseudomonadota bacterium]
MDFNNAEFALVSSNKKKIKEFKRFGLNCSIAEGIDLAEVAGTTLEVIIYKAIMAGKNKVVEDTSLDVEGSDEFGVDIRWQLDSLENVKGKTAKWITLLGVNDGEKIHVFEGVINGVISLPEKVYDDGFGFDQFFVPNNNEKSLYQLEKEGLKDQFSARKNAVDNFIANKPVQVININEVPKWKGDWQ